MVTPRYIVYGLLATSLPYTFRITAPQKQKTSHYSAHLEFKF